MIARRKRAPVARGARRAAQATRTVPTDGAVTPQSTARTGAPLALGPALTITEVRDCCRSLIAMLDDGRATADGSALSIVDTAGLQLLLAAGRAAQERGLKLRLNGAEELLRGHAMALGLDTDLTEVVELTP